MAAQREAEERAAAQRAAEERVAAQRAVEERAMAAQRAAAMQAAAAQARIAVADESSITTVGRASATGGRGRGRGGRGGRGCVGASVGLSACGASVGVSACGGASDGGPATAAPAEDEDANLCVICMQQPRDATIVHGDSGHICCCIACATLLKERGMTCPMCRTPISMVIRHYMSS